MNKTKQFKWTDELVLKYHKEQLGGLSPSLQMFKKRNSQSEYPEGIIAFRYNEKIWRLDKNPGTLKTRTYQEWCELYLMDKKEIYTVKNSKGEEFSIGDRVNYEYPKEEDADLEKGVATVTGFTIVNKTNLHFLYDSKHIKQVNTPINYATKLKQPLFTTHDGVEVFIGDKYYYVRNTPIWHGDENTPDWCEHVEYTVLEACETNPLNDSGIYNQYKNFGNYKVSGIIAFKEKKNAETWIEKNKPKFSEQQILNALQIAPWNRHDYYKTIKEKLGIK